MKALLKNMLIKFPVLFYKFKVEKLICDVNWMDKLTRLYLKVIKIIPRYSINIFFKSYIDLIIDYINRNDYQGDQIIEKWLEKSNKLNDDSKAIMFNIMYLCNLINDKSMEVLYDFLNNTTNKYYRYWMTMDMARMTFKLQKGFYPNYYINRRSLLEKIALESNLKINKQESRGKLKKLCIITYLLDDTIYNSTQRVAMMLAEGLEKYYDEIAIISLESFGVSIKDQRKITTLLPVPCAIKKAKKIRKMFDEKVKIFYLREKGYEKKFHEALDYIYSYNPTTILDMSDEYSVISYYYSKDFPTYYLPLRSNASSSFFSNILTDKFSYEILNKKYNSIEEKKVCHWIFPEYVPNKTISYKRKDLGLLENSFIIITIGNNAIIDEELAKCMNDLLLNKKDIVWLLVGNRAPEFMHKKYQILFDNKRIIEWGFEKNLASLCEVCNIHLRANNTGSSGATAIAAQQGLPIVMTNFICDSMRWLGYDYSNFTNWNQVIGEIIQLYTDKQYYIQKQKQVLDKVKKATNLDEKWKELSSILLQDKEE